MITYCTSNDINHLRLAKDVVVVPLVCQRCAALSWRALILACRIRALAVATAASRAVNTAGRYIIVEQTTYL